MRILTVRPPWAWAIIHGGKDVENRTRNLAGEYRGPVAIHAGLRYDDGWRSPALEVAMDAATLDWSEEQWEGDEPLPWWGPTGAIIGVVDLVDVHRGQTEACPKLLGIHEDGQQEWAHCSPWAEAGKWHLVLANPRLLAEPIPYKGGQGLRWLPDDIAELVNARAAQC